MQMLEHSEGLLQLLDTVTQDDQPKLLLGKESGFIELANVSVIVQRYQQQPKRFIALLGPRRMNYAQLIPLVEACARQLNLNLNRRQASP
jgi:heat-inducible transcriptional repressor